MEVCIICDDNPVNKGKTKSKLTAKGCDSIKRASDLQNANISAVPGQYVHVNCRKNFCSENCIASATKRQLDSSSSDGGPVTRRSKGTSFIYIDNCLFCGNPDKYSGKVKDWKLIPVRTTGTSQTLISICDTRKDAWSDIVRGRIEFAPDLHAADARYHYLCNINFRTGKEIPKQFASSDSFSKCVSKGRPQDAIRAEAFINVANYLQTHDEEQTTINDLITKMSEYLPPDVQPYGFSHMKASIQKHFGEDIVITEINGKPNVVTFRHTASSIISDFHSQPKDIDQQSEKLRIIQAAAQLIKSEVKAVSQPKDVYPSLDDMSTTDKALSFLPESLFTLLNMVFVGKDTDRKIASIGQAIMQAIRPRVLNAPLQLGLAVQMHHHFASKFLIDSLSEHGFCRPYHEVQKFESNAAVSQQTDIPDSDPGDFIQYMADNVDHNIRTIDGSNTFHGMGIIATITPAKRAIQQIPRITLTAEDILSVGQINIKHFTSACADLESLKYERLEQDGRKGDVSNNIDVLWKMSLHLKNPRPAWTGMMQLVNQGPHPGPSSILFLPMIDLDPSNLSCVYSSLVYISDHARGYNATPIITFNQPLWWKALNIIESQPNDSDLHNIVLRLGGFHTLMSFLGCIGHIMGGSGLQQLLEQVYAGNTVSHMLTGKAYDRAVRGHLLVDAALNTIITAKAFGLPLNNQHDPQPTGGGGVDSSGDSSGDSGSSGSGD